MCHDEPQKLTYETMLHDPLLQLIMQSDGVTEDELVSLLEETAAARDADARVTSA